jgi:RecB family endonuclease NucS
MSDLKIFKLAANQVTELSVSSMALEKSLQTLIEKHLDTFLGITFLASEYSTGPKTGGRMDTLGIDENGAPVIIEYKKATNANVINKLRPRIARRVPMTLPFVILNSSFDIPAARHLIELSYEAN